MAPYFKKTHYTNLLSTLRNACTWLGTTRGRATQYETLIQEFFEDHQRSREHILAYHESCEIIELYELWESRINRFPGLDRAMKKVLGKGPILHEDEHPEGSSNRPRNDAFVYLLAGKLLRAGVKIVAIDGVDVDGVHHHEKVDIIVKWYSSIIDIECKRPQTKEALDSNVERAYNQLQRLNRHNPLGIIAINCSAFIRPLGTLLEEDSAERAEEFLSRLLLDQIGSKVQTRFEPIILGFLLFARIPAMIRDGNSPILSGSGKPYYYLRPDSISTTLGCVCKL
jgi:hypothetical protein